MSLGDYCAGSNHVLPTSGTAAFSSGLNVTTFLRAVQVINYNRTALQQVSGHIVSLAGAEDLPDMGMRSGSASADEADVRTLTG